MTTRPTTRKQIGTSWNEPEPGGNAEPLVGGPLLLHGYVEGASEHMYHACDPSWTGPRFQRQRQLHVCLTGPVEVLGEANDPATVVVPWDGPVPASGTCVDLSITLVHPS